MIHGHRQAGTTKKSEELHLFIIVMLSLSGYIVMLSLSGYIVMLSLSGIRESDW